LIQAQIKSYRVSCSNTSEVAAVVPDTAKTNGVAVKPMLNRRLSPLGKKAVALMNELGGDEALPVVWVSRYGDLARTARLMSSVAKNEPLSPIDFSLSVQNAEPGIFSMATHNHQPIVAISCVYQRVYTAFIEAISLMEECERDVLLVFAEQSIPEVYQAVVDNEVEDIAVVVRITPSKSAGLKLGELQSLDGESEFPTLIKWVEASVN